MMDHKGPMNEPSSRIDNLYRRNPRPHDPDRNVMMSHGTDHLWIDSDVDWTKVADDRAATIITQTQTIDGLRADLSAARFQRDIWWPLAFGVGVLCGFSLLVML